jgi:hypothetical protein
MTAPAAGTTTDPWSAHRQRAETLRAHYPFAGEVLALYLALVAVWGEAADAACAQAPAAEARALAGWAGEHVLPRVVEATVEAGPDLLADATRKLVEQGDAGQALVAWLSGPGDDLDPVERYLARASLRAPLEALEAGAGACAEDPSPRGGRRCPRCGGLPQLSFRAETGDGLVSGRRSLLCARCGASWDYSSSACASCGETGGARRTFYAERREWPVVGHAHAPGHVPAPGKQAPGKQAPGKQAPGKQAPGKQAPAPLPTFPHLRIEGCSACNRYLLEVDLGHDARAVPEVDELAALPLDLYAAERGLSKITPNLMGF